MPEKLSFSRGEIPDAKRDTTSRKKESTDKNGENLSEVRRKNMLFSPEKQLIDAQGTLDSISGKIHAKSDLEDSGEDSKKLQKRIKKEHLQEASQKAMKLLDKEGKPYNETMLEVKQDSERKAERAYHHGDTSFPPELDLKKWRANEGKFKDPDVRLSYQSTKDNPIGVGGDITTGVDAVDKNWPSDFTRSDIQELKLFVNDIRKAYVANKYNYFDAVEKVREENPRSFDRFVRWHKHNGTPEKDYLGKTKAEQEAARRLEEEQIVRSRGGGNTSMH